ncbi:unnamed protein product [Polarella glacialis]|uniref:PUM-HD domain-containing protein n=1 Tax=Polarella glacialis TaxID=89957 RepID=A0A813DC24_POLGL|nr:unnamed protein product [Polarella glacialis]CAE8678803.1 unnamed protein product [Polarella glacialis]
MMMVANVNGQWMSVPSAAPDQWMPSAEPGQWMTVLLESQRQMQGNYLWQSGEAMASADHGPVMAVPQNGASAYAAGSWTSPQMSTSAAPSAVVSRLPLHMSAPPGTSTSVGLGAPTGPSGPWVPHWSRGNLGSEQPSTPSTSSPDSCRGRVSASGVRRKSAGRGHCERSAQPQWEGVARHRALAAPSPLRSEEVNGRVWQLSQDPHGCRHVQQAIEDAADDRARADLALELRDHIWEATRCPYSNFVIQKLIMNIRPQSSQFIIDELMARGAMNVARHKYGCRIIQRLLEHCPPDQVRNLTQELLEDAVGLSKHTYANYVMQHLIEHGGGDHQKHLSRILLLNASELGADPNACAVLGKALSLGEPDDKVNLANVLCSMPGLLLKMSHTRYGHAAAKLSLQLVSGPVRVRARSALLADIEALRSTRYGRSVAANLEGVEVAFANSRDAGANGGGAWRRLSSRAFASQCQALDRTTG